MANKNYYDELLDNLATKKNTLIKQLNKMKAPTMIDKYLEDDRINICDVIAADCSPQVFKQLTSKILKEGISADEAQLIANNEDCHILLYDIYSGLDETTIKELYDLGKLEVMNLIAANPTVMEAMNVDIAELENVEVVDIDAETSSIGENVEPIIKTDSGTEVKEEVAESKIITDIKSDIEQKDINDTSSAQTVVPKVNPIIQQQINEVQKQAQLRYDQAKQAYKELLSATVSLSNSLKLIYNEAISLNISEDAIALYKAEEKENIRKDINNVNIKLRKLDEEYSDLLLAEVNYIDTAYAAVENEQAMAMQIEDTPLIKLLHKHYSEALPSEKRSTLSAFAHSYIEVSREQMSLQRGAGDMAISNIETTTKISNDVGKNLPLDDARNALEEIDIDNEYITEAAEDAKEYCDAINPTKNPSLFKEIGDQLLNDFAKALSTQPLSRGRLLQNTKNIIRKHISKIDIKMNHIDKKIKEINRLAYEKEVNRVNRINKIRKFFRLNKKNNLPKPEPSVSQIEKLLTKNQMRQIKRLSLQKAELSLERLNSIEKNIKLSEKQNNLIAAASWNTYNYTFDQKDKKYSKPHQLTLATGKTYKDVLKTIGINEGEYKKLSQAQIEALSIGIDAKFPMNQLKDLAIKHESPEHIGVIIMAHNFGMNYTNVNHFLKQNDNSYEKLVLYLKDKASERIQDLGGKIKNGIKTLESLEEISINSHLDSVEDIKKNDIPVKKDEEPVL